MWRNLQIVNTVACSYLQALFFFSALGRLIVEGSESHNDTHTDTDTLRETHTHTHPVGLL